MDTEVYKRACSNVIRRLKLCFVNEKLLDAEACSRLENTNPMELLEEVKNELYNAIKSSSDLKVNELANSFDQGWEILKKEVQNSLENDILCVSFRTGLNKKIQETGKTSLYRLIYDNDFKRFNDKDEDHIAFLEQWSSVGHPLHPSYKNKLGLSREEVQAYSPEFHNVIKLRILAIENDLINAEMIGIKTDYKHWFSQHYPETYAQANKELTKLGFNPGQYSLIPVHPWQADHVLGQWFDHLVKSQKIIFLNSSQILSSASVSFRTMMPLAPNSFDIKLPITLQLTSVLRYISPAKLYNSVCLSKLVKDIFKQENNFDNTIDFLNENVCVTLKVNEALKISEISTRHLSAIYREKPINYLKEDEIGIPLTALLLNSPIGSKPILIEIIEEHNLIKNQNLETSAREFFQDYACKIIKGPLGIYLKYGVNLECHQQNTIVVFKEGFVQRLIVRDGNGIDIHKPSFDKTGINLNLHPKTNQYYQDRSLRNHLIHCLFRSHLAEIINILSTYYQISARVFWSDLYAIVETEMDKYKGCLPESELTIEKDAILNNNWSYKALMLMRIAETKEIFITGENPFLEYLCSIDSNLKYNFA